MIYLCCGCRPNCHIRDYRMSSICPFFHKRGCSFLHFQKQCYFLLLLPCYFLWYCQNLVGNFSNVQLTGLSFIERVLMIVVFAKWGWRIAVSVINICFRELEWCHSYPHDLFRQHSLGKGHNVIQKS